MVTASHNPPDYNGMKFVREGSRPISGDNGLQDIRKLAEAMPHEVTDEMSWAGSVLERLAELRPLEQRYLRRLAEQKGVADARLDEYRWLLEELRVSLFAQELRTHEVHQRACTGDQGRRVEVAGLGVDLRAQRRQHALGPSRAAASRCRRSRPCRIRDR